MEAARSASYSTRIRARELSPASRKTDRTPSPANSTRNAAARSLVSRKGVFIRCKDISRQKKGPALAGPSPGTAEGRRAHGCAVGAPSPCAQAFLPVVSVPLAHHSITPAATHHAIAASVSRGPSCHTQDRSRDHSRDRTRCRPSFRSRARNPCRVRQTSSGRNTGRGHSPFRRLSPG